MRWDQAAAGITSGSCSNFGSQDSRLGRYQLRLPSSFMVAGNRRTTAPADPAGAVAFQDDRHSLLKLSLVRVAGAGSTSGGGSAIEDRSARGESSTLSQSAGAA